MKIYLCFENNFTGLGSFFDSERLYLLIEKKIKHFVLYKKISFFYKLLNRFKTEHLVLEMKELLI
jgi:hypothetical protein